MSVTPHALSLSTHSTVCTQGCVTAYTQGCVCSQPVGFQPPWTLPDHFASHACQGTPANTAATPASKQTSPRQALHTQHFGSMLYTTECPVCYSIHVVTTLNICAHSNCPQAANCHIQGADQLGSAAYIQHTQAPIVNKPLMQSRCSTSLHTIQAQTGVIGTKQCVDCKSHTASLAGSQAILAMLVCHHMLL